MALMVTHCGLHSLMCPMSFWRLTSLCAFASMQRLSIQVGPVCIVVAMASGSPMRCLSPGNFPYTMIAGSLIRGVLMVVCRVCDPPNVWYVPAVLKKIYHPNAIVFRSNPEIYSTSIPGVGEAGVIRLNATHSSWWRMLQENWLVNRVLGAMASSLVTGNSTLLQRTDCAHKWPPTAPGRLCLIAALNR